MKTIFIDRFDGGMAEDMYAGNVGEYAISKHFDTLTFPNRLAPFRGMSTDTANTGIGQIIVGSNTKFIGLGWDSAFHTASNVWSKVAGGAWTESANYPADLLRYGLLVEYHNSSAVPQLFFSSGSNKIDIVNLDFSTASSHALTYSNVCQGFVHPKDDVLYIGYDNKIAANNNGSWTDVALTLPSYYRVTALTSRGNYLAIACTPSSSGSNTVGRNSVVYLWDRDSSLSTVNEVIDWGAGNLLVLNNLNEELVGITDLGGASSYIRDRDAIQIKIYDGTTLRTVKELSTVKETTSSPDAVVNPRVNFVYRDRLYFSINLQGGSTSPSYIGLWSLGKSKLSRRYATTIERVATTGNTETAVIAAAIIGDDASICHTAEGTLTYTNTTASIGDRWTATSLFESAINPEMTSQLDRVKRKQLVSVAVRYIPLISGAQVVMKYRVDADSTGSWTTIFTETTVGTSVTEQSVFDASGIPFTAGRDYQFRIESTGGAQILGYAYKYEILETTI